MKKLRHILDIIPPQYKRGFRLCVVFSSVNLVLDFVSVIVLVPLFAGLFDLKKVLSAWPYFPETKNQQLLLVAAVALFFVLKNVVSAYMTKYQTTFYYRLANALSINLLEHHFAKSLQEAKAGKNSALVKDIIFIPNNFVTYVLAPLLQLASEALLLLLILAVSFLINPKIMLALVALSVLLIGGIYWCERNRLKAINRHFTGLYNRNFSNILNAVNGYAEIKTSRSEAYFVQKFNDSNTALNSLHAALTADRLIKPKYTETFLVLMISGLFVLSGYLAAGNLLFVSFLFAACIKIIPSVNRILVALTNLKSNLHAVEILSESRPVSKEPIPQMPVAFNESIGLNDVCMAFGNSPALANVSLEIPKGTIAGIFGDSGNGKSTLANILSALMPPDSGQLYCDGMPIDDAHREAYLSVVAYVPQSPFIVEGSLAENLYLDGHIKDPEALERYLELFDLKQTVANLPLGKDTFIGSNGYTLSGGQIQRLAIIRALLRNPELLILDEAANQLDTGLRQKIMDALKVISQARKLTIVSISHNRNELEHFCASVYELENATLTRVK